MDHKSAILDVNEWMRKTDELVADITALVASNAPLCTKISFPRLDFITDRVVDLGFKDVEHFCLSFPSKFDVDASAGVINLSLPKRQENTLEPQHESVLDRAKLPHIEDATFSLLAHYNPVPPSMTASRMRKEENLKMESEKSQNFIHFKLSHEQKTRRFAFPRDEKDLIVSVKHRVQEITGYKKAFLFWKDDECLVVLECGEDMRAAVDFAERTTKPPCIVIEATAPEEETKEVEREAETEETKEGHDGYKEQVATSKVVTREESCAAFNDFAFRCDSCDTFLAASNGGRYKCTICANFDICASCVTKNTHANHALIRLLNGETIVPLSDGEGGIRHVQVMDTPRCTPSFVVAQNYDEPARLHDAIVVHNREFVALDMAKLRSLTRKEGNRGQRANGKEVREEDADVEDECVHDGNMVDERTEIHVEEHDYLNKPGFENDEEKSPQKTAEQIRREENLKNAIEPPFVKMLEEDREAWRIFKAERELYEKKRRLEEKMEEEEREQRRRIDARMRREEIRRLEKERTKIENALAELKMKMEEQSLPISSAREDKVGRNVIDKSTRFEKDEDLDCSHLEAHRSNKARDEDENYEAVQQKDIIYLDEDTNEIEEVTPLGCELEIVEDAVEDMEEEESDDHLHPLDCKFDQPLQPITPLLEHPESIADAAAATAAARESADPSAADDLHDLPELIETLPPAKPKRELLVATSAGDRVDECTSSANMKEVWPSDLWKAYKHGDPATKKFLENKKEFFERQFEIERIPAHLERQLLAELPELSSELLLRKLAEFYCLVHNNIRLHTFQEHVKALSESKEVENEMIRLIAVDLSKRLFAMTMTIGYANTKIPQSVDLGEARRRLIWVRLSELDNQLKSESTKNLDCKYSAMQLRPILLLSTYTIQYEPNENSFENAFVQARDFVVKLQVQAKIRLQEIEGEEEENGEKKEIEKKELNSFQQNLLEQMVETGIFCEEDYDKMIEACRNSLSLEHAVEKMFD